MDAHVFIRPYAEVILSYLAECCEVVVFTASAAAYADRVLDFLDPEKKKISHRLYRPSCTEIGGGYFKDMRLLGRRQEDSILVDNSPLAVALTPENGILCKSW